MMKLIEILSITILLVSTSCVVVDAHGGNTDKNGCHKQETKEVKHCHISDLNNTHKLKIITYDRRSYNFHSYKYPTETRSFYTGSMTCKLTVDHIVSLKDLNISGAHRLSKKEKFIIANDKENHAPSCSRINKSKGSSTPGVFFRKSMDQKGLDFDFLEDQFCNYLKRYVSFKRKYQLSFSNNKSQTFEKCGLKINR